MEARILALQTKNDTIQVVAMKMQRGCDARAQLARYLIEEVKGNELKKRKTVLRLNEEENMMSETQMSGVRLVLEKANDFRDNHVECHL